MADILETFDFDDKPGLEKIKALLKEVKDLNGTVEDLKKKLEGGFDEAGKQGEKLQKQIGGISKKTAAYATAFAGLAGAAVIFFNKAVKGFEALADNNDRVLDNSEKLEKRWDKLRSLLAEKIAPIVHVIQESTRKWLDNTIKNVDRLNNNGIIKFAAHLAAITKTIKSIPKQIGQNLKIAGLEIRAFGKQARAAFDPFNAARLRAEAKGLLAESKRLTGEALNLKTVYKDTFDSTKKRLTDLVQNGYFKWRKANEEEIKKIMKLRDEYKKLAAEVIKRLGKEEIANAEGLEKLELERKFALEQIDLLESKARAAAKAAKIQFDLEDEFRKLRENAELAHSKKVNDLLISQAKEVSKQIQKEFKDRFGIALDDVDDFGKKVAKEQLDSTLSFMEDLTKGIEARSKIILENMDKNFLVKFKENLLAAFNINEQELGFIMGELNGFFGELGNAYTASIERQIAGQDEIIAKIQERANIIEEELSREYALQARGRENNVLAKKRELEAIRKEEAKAEKEKAKLQKRLLNAQLIQDGIQQTSSLITAAASIFKSTGKFGPVGIGLAIGLISTMFSLMTKFRSQARSLSKPERAYKGGRLTGRLERFGWVNRERGRTDKNGAPGHRVEDSNLLLGGKEMVVAETPANHQSDNFWNNMNAGKYDKVDIGKILSNIDRPEVKSIVKSFNDRQVKIIQLQTDQQKELTRSVMKELLKEQSQDIIKYWKSRPIYVVESDNTTQVTKYTDQKEERIKKAM